jgi:hypothetical protein
MNLWLLKPGHKIRTHDGAEAEVLAETEDGEWIRVRRRLLPRTNNASRPARLGEKTRQANVVRSNGRAILSIRGGPYVSR